MGFQPNSRLKENIRNLVVGPLMVNTYILIDPKTCYAAIIDPGAEDARILFEVERLNVHPTIILNTHTHGDHIGGNGAIKAATMAPLAVHRAEAEWLADPSANLSNSLGFPIVSPPADILLEGNESLQVGDLELKVLHTPGHSPGSVCFVVDNAVFCGDLIFREGVGRTDLAGGDTEQLIHSIRHKILTLPEDTVLYPGHGPSTTVGYEKRTNLFL
ncbi:MAG TPA: MBL fold metallo-hydrolase [bacterium]|nr:MBL fold metallo-hydrolase [bacterium]HQL63037.1 MBL fold metallo-hydrolase [bacterium]